MFGDVVNGDTGGGLHELERELLDGSKTGYLIRRNKIKCFTGTFKLALVTLPAAGGPVMRVTHRPSRCCYEIPEMRPCATSPSPFDPIEVLTGS